MKKTVSLMLAALLLCVTLSSCGEAAAQKNVSAAALADTVAEAIGMKDAMADTTDVVVEGYMRLSRDQFGDCAVYHSNRGTGVDEFGVFKAGTLSSAEVKSAAEDYLTMLRETSMASLYTPEELPKLDNAAVKAVGNYVMYAVLSDADRDAAFKAFEAALK